MKENNVVERLHRRTKKLGIELDLVGNYPWIYLNKVNGNAVKEKYLANHGFTIAFLPVRLGQPMELTDTKKVFQTIRKYL